MKDYSNEMSAKFEGLLSDPASKPADLASAWKAMAEAEKVRMDIANAAQVSHLEKLKFWVPIAVSLITAVALVSTLIFQVVQFKENTAIAKGAAEDIQWRETLNRAHATSGPEATFFFTLLKSFFISPRYGAQAREICVGILGGTVQSDLFDNLFRDIMVRTTPENMQDVVKISKLLNDTWNYNEGELEQLRAKNVMPASTNARASGLRWDSGSTKSNDLIHIKNEIDQELRIVSRGLVAFLREGKHASRGKPLALNSFVFYNGDLSKLDLSAAEIEKAEFWFCNLTNASLDKITAFQGSSWDGTPWWEAKKISPELLDYLIRDWSYVTNDTNFSYLGRDWAVGLAEFTNAVNRLKKN